MSTGAAATRRSTALTNPRESDGRGADGGASTAACGWGAEERELVRAETQGHAHGHVRRPRRRTGRPASRTRAACAVVPYTSSVANARSRSARGRHARARPAARGSRRHRRCSIVHERLERDRRGVGQRTEPLACRQGARHCASAAPHRRRSLPLGLQPRARAALDPSRPTSSRSSPGRRALPRRARRARTSNRSPRNVVHAPPTRTSRCSSTAGGSSRARGRPSRSSPRRSTRPPAAWARPARCQSRRPGAACRPRRAGRAARRRSPVGPTATCSHAKTGPVSSPSSSCHDAHARCARRPRGSPARPAPRLATAAAARSGR